jgi:hypothetical protein
MTEKLTYLIQTSLNEQYKETVNFEVSRSFSDFAWL